MNHLVEQPMTQPDITATKKTERIAYLPGIPTLSDFAKFVQRRTVAGRQVQEADIISQWGQIDDRYSVLAQDEKDLPDQIDITRLPDRLQPLIDKVMEDRYFVRCFDAIPVSFAMVELDKLIAVQEYVNLEHVARVSKRIPRKHTAEQLLNVCLPYEKSNGPVSLIQDDSKSFIFQSESTDFRAFPAELLEQQTVELLAANGPLSGVVALPVGFGPNYLSGIRYGRRVILNNGYHRAYTLRSLGITHAPMAIQVYSRAEEIAFIAGEKKTHYIEAAVEQARPPMFKDFFDPSLVVELLCPRVRRQIKVSVEVVVSDVPE